MALSLLLCCLLPQQAQSDKLFLHWQKQFIEFIEFIQFMQAYTRFFGPIWLSFRLIREK